MIDNVLRCFAALLGILDETLLNLIHCHVIAKENRHAIGVALRMLGVAAKDRKGVEEEETPIGDDYMLFSGSLRCRGVDSEAPRKCREGASGKDGFNRIFHSY